MDNYDKHDMAVAYAQAILQQRISTMPGLSDDDPPKQYEGLCLFVKSYQYAMKNLEEAFNATNG